MATTNTQVLAGPRLDALPVYNYGGTDIPAFSAVIVDASNIIDNAGVKNQLGVTLPTDTTNPSIIIGVTATIIPAGNTGMLQPAGPVIQVQCDGAVTAGSWVDNSTSSTKTGRVKSHSGGKNSMGIALETGADADFILVMLAVGPNA